VSSCVAVVYLVLLLLMELFQRQTSLLVLAALVLEPDSDDSRTQSSHLDQLLLHQRVRSRVGRVAGAQRVKLFLVQDGPDAGGLRLGAAVTGPCPTTRPPAAVRAAVAVVDRRTSWITAGRGVRRARPR